VARINAKLVLWMPLQQTLEKRLWGESFLNAEELPSGLAPVFVWRGFCEAAIAGLACGTDSSFVG
jgi:hypothetical protein